MALRPQVGRWRARGPNDTMQITVVHVPQPALDRRSVMPVPTPDLAVVLGLALFPVLQGRHGSIPA